MEKTLFEKDGAQKFVDTPAAAYELRHLGWVEVKAPKKPVKRK